MSGREQRMCSTWQKNASQMGITGIGTLLTTTVRMAIAVVGILPVLVIYPFL